MVRVESTVLRLGTSSFVMGYRAHSRRHDAPAAEGEGVIVLFDYRAERKVALDEALLEAVDTLESQGGWEGR